jgi:hypothetical protein
METGSAGTAIVNMALSYFENVFSVLTGFSVNLSANLQAVEIIWE